MTVEKAIESAIAMEARIRDVYARAQTNCSDKAGQRVFGMLKDDEQYHLDYLNKRLVEWRQHGEMQLEPLKTVVPTAGEIRMHLNRLRKTMAMDDRGMLQQMLSKALQVEVQTSDFYKKMVYEYDGKARDMFARFLEIEDGHIEAVQAELDYVIKTGYWFDFKEFDME